jgi:hypothetical protein
MPSVLGDGQASDTAKSIAPVVDTAATEPRAGLIDDVIDELRWTLAGRKGWLLGMAANLALAIIVVGYQHYDPHVSGDIKIANIGVAVVVYVLAGTLATNQLGADADRALNSLERGDSVPRILALKNVALAVLLVPVALLVSLIVRIMVDRWRLMANTALFDTAAVFVWLGLGNIISVMLPYRPISLRARLKARKTWKRWAVRQAVPYALYYLGVPALLMLPTVLAHQLKLFGHQRLLYYPLLALGNSLVAWLFGLWLATAWTARQRSRFMAELHHPE